MTDMQITFAIIGGLAGLFMMTFLTAFFAGWGWRLGTSRKR